MAYRTFSPSDISSLRDSLKQFLGNAGWRSTTDESDTALNSVILDDLIPGLERLVNDFPDSDD